MMEQELSFPGNPDDLARHNVLLADIDAFVARINAMVGQLEADAEERIQRFRNILGAALMLLLLLCAMAIHVIRRNIFVPLSGLLKGAERLAQGDFSVRVERVGPDELGRLGQIFNSTAGELSRSYGELERKIAEKMTELTASLSRKAEQERMLALQEERSIIARELHDSIAQALSYLKIQASLLAPLLSDPARSVEAAAVLSDMRNGIAAAYRQLRELLATFRLKMEGDFFELLDATANEYSQRGGLQVDLDVCLDQCHLTPNQEIHILQIVREALSNVLHHANATRVWITMRYIPIPSELRVTVADDGAGFDQAALLVGLHYGLAIMDERARELYGHLSVRPRPGGGTLVSLSFDPFNKLESVA
jgi:nitrate/nitrite-specific signal transduction histidine kinase